jgi:hypothetical protein
MRDALDLDWKRKAKIVYDSTVLIDLIVFGSLCGRMAGQYLKLGITSPVDTAL